MGKIIRRVVAVLLCATALILAILPAPNVEATSTHGDYEYDGATVAKYLGKDVDVTLPAWVNRVGKEAFEGYSPMQKLVIPDAVTTVDFGAFSNCDKLQTVKMSESVRTLGSAAFSGCTDLYSVSTLPKSVRSIGSGVFAGCRSLANVEISPANENYTSHDGVIYTIDGKKLVQYLAGRPSTTYKMPTAVKEIEEYAFWGAENLAKVSITSGVDKIPEYAFSNCKGLQHITLPRSVQSIFAYAFEDCDSLSYINIPDTVGYIDDRAFANTKGAKLRFYDASGSVVRTFNSDDVEKYGNGTAGSTTVKQPEYTDDTATAAETSSATANGSTTYYEDGTTNTGFDPTNVTPLDEGDVADDGSGNISNNNSNATEASASTDGVNVGKNSLYNDGYYKASDSGTKPWDTQIEYHDYEDNMTANDLGAGKIVGGVAVLKMSSDVPVKGFDLGDAESEDDYGSTGGRKKSDSDVIGDVYASYSGDADSVNIPAGVNTVGNRSFYKNENVKNVSLPNSITDIGEFAFARSGLTGIKLPNGTKRIDYAAFYKCPNLTDVYIPESVDSIALGAFDGTPFLEGWKQNGAGDFLVVGDGVLLAYKGSDKKVVIPDDVKHIGPAAFEANVAVESVVIPGTVEDIGEEAFSDCNNLKELVLQEGIKNINDRAFKNSALNAVYIPDSVEGIGLSAFDNNGTLKSVIFKGNDVPNVTYNRSATRLSAKDLRTGAFEGARFAIVGSNCNLDDGTMFDPKYYGFAGEVYSVDPGDDKMLVLERVLTVPDAAGNVMINQKVTLAGIEYMVDQVKSDAFDSYKNWSQYYDNKPTNVTVNGEQSDELVALLGSVNNDVLADTEEESEDYNRSNITVSVDGKRFPTRGKAHASIPGDEDMYFVSVTEDESASGKINTAFMHSDGAKAGDMVPLSIEMYDKKGSIPIHKLGTSKMEVTLPVPNGMEADPGVAIAGLDDNGALEPLSSELVDEAGEKNIKFVASHFSTYVIYSRTVSATAFDENGNPIETVDEAGAGGISPTLTGTWQTINKKVYGQISAKWLIIIIMLGLAGVLALYKPSRRRVK
ncbi:MAG: leucine-rich repeat domain-containing protein [Lachnospiraceae bacterium]|nr:leucine-rich repeat domain-containing protein [Lachnospiraceae bacterium]